MKCGDVHPSGVQCDRDANEPDHAFHQHGEGAFAVHWRNLSELPSVDPPQVPPTSQGKNSWMNGAAGRAKGADRAVDPVPPHSAHRNSSIAWEDYQSRLSRRKREVYTTLLRMKGIWINGIHLHTSGVGGSQGLKRLRELRADFDENPRFGLKIEERPVEDSDWDYRLVDRNP